MKRFIVKGFVVFVALMVMGTGMAMAFDDYEHVKVAPNGKGDLVIFPFYFAMNGGWSTKITVTNTSNTFSVVAKLVVRSHLYSQELLDFLLYLTPDDVWTGTFTNDGVNTYIESTDDSALAPNGQFTSATNPMKQQLYDVRCAVKGDSTNYGYVEVIEAWYGDLTQAGYNGYVATGESRTRPVSKSLLKKVYDDAAAPIGLPRLVAGATDRTINVLTGFEEFQNLLVPGMTSSERASVFADWNNTTRLTTADVTGLTNASRNTLGELEAAMSKSDIAMPYLAGTNMTVHLFNFPTKISQYSLAAAATCSYMDGLGPYFDDPNPNINNLNIFATDEYRCPSYSNTNYDLMEYSGTAGPYSGTDQIDRMCEEVNLLLSTKGFSNLTPAKTIFTEGWTRYTFTNTGGANREATQFAMRQAPGTVTHSYYGTPVIPLVLMFKNGGISLMKGSYTDGHVYGRLIAANSADPNALTTAVQGEFSVYTVTAGAAAPASWPNGLYAAPNSWLPEYQYYNYIPALGRDSF